MKTDVMIYCRKQIEAVRFCPLMEIVCKVHEGKYIMLRCNTDEWSLYKSIFASLGIEILFEVNHEL